MGQVILVNNNYADGDLVEESAATLEKMNAISTVTIDPSDWAASGTGFTATKTVTGMTASTYPLWYYNGTPNEAQYEAFCAISSMTTATDSVTFRFEDSPKPAVALSIMIKGL